MSKAKVNKITEKIRPIDFVVLKIEIEEALGRKVDLAEYL